MGDGQGSFAHAKLQVSYWLCIRQLAAGNDDADRQLCEGWRLVLEPPAHGTGSSTAR